MSIIVGLVIGTAIGWIASLVADAGGREALIRNVAVGIAGAFAGAWVLGLIASADPAGIGFGSLSASLLGAAALLLVVHRVSRA